MGRNWIKLNRVLILLAPLASLMVFAVMGFHSRYLSDDYISTFYLQDKGFWGAQVFFWNNWTGRYSFITTLLFFELFDVAIAPILPTLYLLFWLTSLGWATYHLIKDQTSSPLLLSLCIACLITWTSIRSVDTYPEIIFWLTGIINYASSPILLALGAGYYLKRSGNAVEVRKFEAVFFLIFAFISGGFSETVVAAQVAILSVAMVIAFVSKSQNTIQRWLLAAALTGSLLSLGVNLLSPGNFTRAGDVVEFSSAAKILPQLKNSLIQAIDFMPAWFKSDTFPSLLALLTGAFLNLFFQDEKPNVSISWGLKQFGLAGMVVLFGIWAALSPSFVIRGFAPPGRALLIPYFFASILAIYLGWLTMCVLRTLFPKKLVDWAYLGLPLALYLVIFAGPISTTTGSIKFLPHLQTYSRMWDERDQLLRESAAQGLKRVSVTNFQRHPALSQFDHSSVWMVGDFDEEPSYWINRGAAWYYGIKRISSR